MIEIVALAGALADAGEHRGAAMALGDVVDQLLDQHGLADAGAAEQADLAALRIRREQVDDLDAGDEDRVLGRLVDEERRLGVDRGGVGVADRAALVDRLADDVHDPAERHRADRHADLRAGVGDLLAAGQALGRVHRDRADGALAEMLRDLEDEAVAVIVGLERRQDRRQLAVERHVDDGADHLADPAGTLVPAGAVLVLVAVAIVSSLLVPGEGRESQRSSLARRTEMSIRSDVLAVAAGRAVDPDPLALGLLERGGVARPLAVRALHLVGAAELDANRPRRGGS